MSQYPGGAAFSTESMTPFRAIADDTDLISQRAVIATAAGSVAYLQVLGQITASGKMTKHNPGASDGSQIAVAVAAYAVDATGGDVTANVYSAGAFDINALVYHSTTDTEAERLAVFPFTSSLKVRKPLYGAT